MVKKVGGRRVTTTRTVWKEVRRCAGGQKHPRPPPACGAPWPTSPAADWQRISAFSGLPSKQTPAPKPPGDNLQTSRRSPFAELGVSLALGLFDTKLPVGLIAKQPAYHPFPQVRTWSHSHARLISEAATWHWPGSDIRSYPVGQVAVELSPST